MKKKIVIGALALLLMLGAGGGVMAANEVSKVQDDIIVDGVYAGDINLSGLTAEEAEAEIKSYIDTLESKTITMVTGEHEDVLKLSDIGIKWKNKDIVEEAVSLGKSGNLIARFKELTDLKTDNKVYDLELAVSSKKIKKYITETIKPYNQEAKEPSLKKSGGSFVVTKE